MLKQRFLTVLAAGMILGGFTAAPETYGAASSTVSHTLGTVQVRTRVGWRATHSGARLWPGMTLRTGRGSRIQLQYDDGSVVRLGSNSLMRIRPARNLRLLKGKTWIKKQKNNQRLRVRTPIAHATVLGTELFVSHSDKNVSHVTTLTGEVQVETEKGEKTLVTAGNWVEIEPDKPLEVPTKFDWNELKKQERLLLDLDFIPTAEDSGEADEDWM